MNNWKKIRETLLVQIIKFSFKSRNLILIGGILFFGGLAEAKAADDSKVSISSPVINSECLANYKRLPINVDLNKLRQTWLNWNNAARKEAGLNDYARNIDLAFSATTWSNRAVQKGAINHQRDGQSAYYDYNKINAWFKNLGLQFKNVKRATFTENIGWGYYQCPADTKADCTEALTKAIRTTFDFFIGEKNKKYRPHYESLMKPEFKIIGLGIALDQAKHKYYLTVHYGTEIVSKNLPLCKS